MNTKPQNIRRPIAKPGHGWKGRTRGDTQTVLIAVLGVLLLGLLVFKAMPKPVVHLDESVWQNDLVNAKAEASKAGDKPVLALFTADWCGPCQRLKSDVLTDPAVAADLERVVPLYVDLTSVTPGSWQEQLASRFAVQSIPTLILLSDEEEMLGQQAGMISAKALTAWIDETVAEVE